MDTVKEPICSSVILLNYQFHFPCAFHVIVMKLVIADSVNEAVQKAFFNFK